MHPDLTQVSECLFLSPLFLSDLGYQLKRMQKGEFGEGME